MLWNTRDGEYTPFFSSFSILVIIKLNVHLATDLSILIQTIMLFTVHGYKVLIDCWFKRLVAFVLDEERFICTHCHGLRIKEILRGINLLVGSVN